MRDVFAREMHDRRGFADFIEPRAFVFRIVGQRFGALRKTTSCARRIARQHDDAITSCKQSTRQLLPDEPRATREED